MNPEYCFCECCLHEGIAGIERWDMCKRFCSGCGKLLIPIISLNGIQFWNCEKVSE